MAKSGKMKNTRCFRIVCATLTYIYTIAVCSTSEVVEELVCMGRWRPPGALHVHLGSVAALRAAATAASASSAIATTRLLWRRTAALAAPCASGRVHAHYYIAEAGHNLLVQSYIWHSDLGIKLNSLNLVCKYFLSVAAHSWARFEKYWALTYSHYL